MPKLKLSRTLNVYAYFVKRMRQTVDKMGITTSINMKPWINVNLPVRALVNTYVKPRSVR